VEISPETRQEFAQRFALIYTGQRRLARNLLRSVVGRYVGAEPDSLYALAEIQSLAQQMRTALEKGDVDGFAQLLNQHWALLQKIDAGSTNTLINQIFDSVADLIDGAMVCGAGGGGFLQVILKKGVSRDEVHHRLKEIFQDTDVDIWDCTLV
jgi:fucokinase